MGRPVMSESTFSEQSLNLAKRWVSNCLVHPLCNTTVMQWYPTRLLDLGNIQEPNTDQIRLVHSEHCMLVGNYTTLSHRWGGQAHLRLTRHNLAALCQSIDVRILPRTFREAIQISRHLGARYLWIDSLCILQDPDDKSDWLQESSRMEQVYQHSYCNISASDALDSTQGLFRSRSPAILQPAIVSLNPKVRRSASSYISYTLEVYEM